MTLAVLNRDASTQGYACVGGNNRLASTGNVTRETVKCGDGSTSLRITRAFDELGRVVNETVGTGHASRWGYDKVGNVVSEISPNGHETTTAFDALDRLITTVAPDSGSTALAFDDSDNLTSHTDPIAVTTEFVHNGFGEVIQEVSPDRGISTYVYDAAGRVTQSSDGRGQVIDYTYDYLGRLTGKVPQGRPASEAIAYHWDTGGLAGSYQVGRLAKVADGSGTTLFRYDHRGNMTAKQQAIGATGAAELAYEYDVADRITQITYPSGRQVRYGYDGKGRVNLVETRASAAAGSWTVVASGHGYEPFGAVAAMTLGNGLAVENTWGSDGLLASRRLFEASSGTSLSYLSYRYDGDGNIGGITDHVTPANSAIYGYDEVGRLTLAVADTGTTGSQSYAYTSGTNQLASVTDASGTRTIAYDDRGNTLTETRPGGVAAAAAYDGHGRLTGYERTGAGPSAFVYNGLDDRVTMALATAGTRRFVYDADGRVMGEYGASAADVKAEFIWALPQVGAGSPFGGDDGLGGYMPLAVATPDTTGQIQLNWVHGNHLGVPLVITGFGGGATITPDEYLAPGFPGQSRVLADLYYNRYRDYDPITGRYIQADPIGLAGGSNPYLYANGNPVNLFDPTGEVVPIVVGAVIGAGLEYLTNPCATASDIILAGALGGIGGGIGKLAFLRYGARARYGKTGHEWSHAVPERIVNRYTSGGLNRALNRRGGYNGSWARPPRHYRHDPYRYPRRDSRYPQGYRGMGEKWGPAASFADRIPDWAKASVGSGIAASVVAGRSADACECQ